MRRSVLVCAAVAAAAVVVWRAWPSAPAPARGRGDAALPAREELVASLARTPRAPQVAPAPAELRRVAVRVIDGVGRPVANARVELRATETRALLGAGVSGADGVAELAADADGVVARLLTFGEIGATARTPDGDEGATAELDPGDPLVEVGPVAMLHGVVVDERGEPVDGARIDPRGGLEWRDGTLLDDGGYLGALPPPSLAVAVPEDDLDALLHTAADGTFVVPLRVADVYDVVAVADGHAAHASGKVQVVPGSEAQVRIVLASGGAISGRVVDDDGAPVEGAAVHLGSGDVEVDLETDARGAFRGDGLSDGAYEVHADAPGFRPASMSDVPAGGPPVVLRLSLGARLEARICLRGVPLEAVSLDLFGPRSRATVTELAGPDGCATFHETGLREDAAAGAVFVTTSHLAAALDPVRLTDGTSTRLDATVPATPVDVQPVPGALTSFEVSMQGDVQGDGWSFVHSTEGSLVLDVSHAARWNVWLRSELTAAPGTASLVVGADSPRSVVPRIAPLPIEPRAWRPRLAPPVTAIPCEPVELWLDDTSNRYLVDAATRAAPERLFAGDEVLAIDGVAVDVDGAGSASLEGPCDEAVHVRVHRPATGETLDLAIARH